MNRKLTLSLDENIISQAKRHLQADGSSLSKLVEDYFKTLINAKNSKLDNTASPITSQLTGVAKSIKNPDETIIDYLEEKYS